MSSPPSVRNIRRLKIRQPPGLQTCARWLTLWSPSLGRIEGPASGSLEMAGQLLPGEDLITVETGQCNPFGFPAGPAQRLQSLLASLERLNPRTQLGGNNHKKD